MYKLVQVGENTYYFPALTNIGVYRFEENDVCLIDSGDGPQAGQAVAAELERLGFRIKFVLNTHAHVDHIGGSDALQRLTGCRVYIPREERSILFCPKLHAALLYGGTPPKEAAAKFFTENVETLEMEGAKLPEGLTLLKLPGHSAAMTAVGTDDGIWFLGDALMGDVMLDKFKITYNFDIEQYLASLDDAEKLSGKLFIPSHGTPVTDAGPLLAKNRAAAFRIAQLLLTLCREPIPFDRLLQCVFERYRIPMKIAQHLLIGSTVRSYLSYLKNIGRMEYIFDDNILFYRALPASGGNSPGADFAGALYP